MEFIKEIADEAIKNIGKMKQDQEIKNETNLLSYHNLITENIRNNNKQITRNSYIMILCMTLYFLIFIYKTNVSEITILFYKINDNTLLLNFIPVVFAFLYLRNITLWNNNINLIYLFKSNSSCE